MEQPELPDMPPRLTVEGSDPPRVRETVQVLLYVPTDPEDEWTARVLYQFPGGYTSRSLTAASSYTPAAVMRRCERLVADLLLELEPF